MIPSARRIRQAVTTRVDRIELREADAPQAGPGEALVRVELVGLCGSDYHMLDGTHPYSRFPAVQGHELVGSVLQLNTVAQAGVTVGARVAMEPLLSCGDCFACRRGRANCCEQLRVLGVQVDGGLSELIAVPVRLLHPVGDLAPDIAVLCEPMSIGLHAVARTGLGASDDVVVIGAGPIGLAATIAAADLGAAVTVVDRVSHRLQLAREVGAVATVNTAETNLAEALASPPGVVIEATGVPALVRAAIDVVAHSGVVVIVGVSTDEVGIPVSEFSRKELSVVGSRNSCGEFAAAVDLVTRHRDELARLVTHRFGLDAVGEAIRFARANPETAEKVVIDVAGLCT